MWKNADGVAMPIANYIISEHIVDGKPLSQSIIETIAIIDSVSRNPFVDNTAMIKWKQELARINNNIVGNNYVVSIDDDKKVKEQLVLVNNDIKTQSENVAKANRNTVIFIVGVALAGVVLYGTFKD